MKRWLRHRRKAPRLTAAEQANSWQLVSLLLAYPDVALLDGLPDLRRVAGSLPEKIAGQLEVFLDHLEATSLQDLQSDYVETFDVTRKCCLHLTYFLHGDTRSRGPALVHFKQVYRRAGVELADEDVELPDHLSVVLEFGASVDSDAAWKILNDHRVGIELLRRGLQHRQSPWQPVVLALRATLPDLEDDDEVALAKLIAQGPPQEEVGIDTSPYPLDPALDQLRVPPTAAGCGTGGTPQGPTFVGATIDVGARS